MERREGGGGGRSAIKSTRVKAIHVPMPPDPTPSSDEGEVMGHPPITESPPTMTAEPLIITASATISNSATILTSAAGGARAAPAGGDEDDDDEEDDEDRDDEPNASQPPPHKKPRRAARPAVVLTDLEMEAMAEFLQANEGLYNKAKGIWRDSAARVRLFEQQAATMATRTGPGLQQWYEGLRSKLGRLKKKAQRSGSGAGVLNDSHKYLLELFHFLTPHIMEVQRRTPVRLRAKLAMHHKEEDDGEDDAADVADTASNTSASQCTSSQDQTTTPCPLTSFSGRQAWSQPHHSMREQDMDLLGQLIQHQQSSDNIMALSTQLLRHLEARPRTTQNPEREQFASWVGSVFQELPADLYRRASRMISNIIHDVLEEASSRPEQQQQ